MSFRIVNNAKVLKEKMNERKKKNHLIIHKITIHNKQLFFCYATFFFSFFFLFKRNRLRSGAEGPINGFLNPEFISYWHVALCILVDTFWLLRYPFCTLFLLD